MCCRDLEGYHSREQHVHALKQEVKGLLQESGGHLVTIRYARWASLSLSFLSSRALLASRSRMYAFLNTFTILSTSPSNLEPQTVGCRHSRDRSRNINDGGGYKLEPLQRAPRAVAPPAGESQPLGLGQSETFRG